jgi:hypothetical protein
LPGESFQKNQKLTRNRGNFTIKPEDLDDVHLLHLLHEVNWLCVVFHVTLSAYHTLFGETQGKSLKVMKIKQKNLQRFLWRWVSVQQKKAGRRDADSAVAWGGCRTRLPAQRGMAKRLPPLMAMDILITKISIYLMPRVSGGE